MVGLRVDQVRVEVVEQQDRTVTVQPVAITQAALQAAPVVVVLMVAPLV